MPQKKKKQKQKKDSILLGNGQHKAIAELKGVLVPNPDEPDNFTMILPDQSDLKVTVRNKKVLRGLKRSNAFGLNTYLGYPKVIQGKLDSLDLIAWGDRKLEPIKPEDTECWEFVGVWSKNKELLVQRDVKMPFVQDAYQATGKLFTYKFAFTNGDYYTMKKKLVANQLYCLKCIRKKGQLRIRQIINLS